MCRIHLHPSVIEPHLRHRTLDLGQTRRRIRRLCACPSQGSRRLGDGLNRHWHVDESVPHTDRRRDVVERRVRARAGRPWMRSLPDPDPRQTTSAKKLPLPTTTVRSGLASSAQTWESSTVQLRPTAWGVAAFVSRARKLQRRTPSATLGGPLTVERSHL